MNCRWGSSWWMNIYLGHGMSASRYCAARPSVVSRSFSGAFSSASAARGRKTKRFFFPSQYCAWPLGQTLLYNLVGSLYETKCIHFCFISINPTLRSFSRLIMSLNNIWCQSGHLTLRGHVSDTALRNKLSSAAEQSDIQTPHSCFASCVSTNVWPSFCFRTGTEWKLSIE